MTSEYMFQKFKLVLFLLADRTADLISPQSLLRLQDKLNISDGSVFHIRQEAGFVQDVCWSVARCWDAQHA